MAETAESIAEYGVLIPGIAVIMVDSNIQREGILPGEKANAYAMKYEAMKHQGKKSGMTTLEKVGGGGRREKGLLLVKVA